MEVVFTPEAKRHLEYWKKSGDKAIQKKIGQLLQDITLHPYEGLGKPEALKHNLSGKWSRRINKEHRIIYNVTGNIINVYALKDHY